MSKKKRQSVRIGVFRIWCRLKELNPRPSHYKCAALPTELSRLKMILYGRFFKKATHFLKSLFNDA